MSSPGSAFCAHYFGIRFTPHPIQPRHHPCYRSSTHVKDPGHSVKGAGGSLQLNTHTPYTYISWLCMIVWCRALHDCMVYAEHAPRMQQFHVACKKNQIAVSTPLQWIFKNAIQKAIYLAPLLPLLFLFVCFCCCFGLFFCCCCL